MIFPYQSTLTPTDNATRYIRASELEVSGSVSTTAKVIVVVGMLGYLAGSLIFITLPPGSTYFWVGGAEALIGATSPILAYVCYESDCRRQQMSPLPFVKSAEKYQELLEEDQGVKTVYRLDNFLTHFDQLHPPEKLNAETEVDLGRALYAIEGKKIESDELKKRFGDKAHYATQATVGELLAILHGRYSNPAAGFMISQKSQKQGKESQLSTLFDLKSKGDVLEVTRIFALTEINTLKAKYILAKIRIDFKTKEAKLSWTSPQNVRPSLLR